MSFKPSPNQLAIFDFVEHGRGSAIINAVAGSGKTTTIVKATTLIPSTQRVTFLAFNKRIATELQSRVPAHVKAATFHSVGYSAWRRFRENTTITDSKVRDLLKLHFPQNVVEFWGSAMIKLVSIAKSAGIGFILTDDPVNWSNFAEHHDVEFADSPNAKWNTIQAAQRLLALSVAQACQEKSVIDFDDMLYMPLLKDVPFFRSDWLFVDESQDTNQVQLAMLRKMIKPTGRVIAVGDRRQAIYGFRGADAKAMDSIRDAFNCRELPLTISYRCAQAVVKYAQSIVPVIEASPTAPEGEVIHDQSLHTTKFTPEDVVICRNTTPLVELAYQLIGKGQGCRVLGREIGQALATLIGKMKATSLEDLVTKLDVYAAREIDALILKGQDQKAEAVRDKTDCIKAIINYLPETRRTVQAVLDSIADMFTDNGAGARLLTLCTAHKSKGLEWERVYMFRPELMPSRWARQQWQQDQESNLQYVAWTRAKRSLVFLSEIVPQQPQKPAQNPELTAHQDAQTAWGVKHGYYVPAVKGHTALSPDDFWAL